jgi:hypothetical protein
MTVDPKYTADYSQLTNWQKLTWLFHQDLTYDVFIFQDYSPHKSSLRGVSSSGNRSNPDNGWIEDLVVQDYDYYSCPQTRIYLIERFTLWEYEWAEGYCLWLKNLYKTKDFNVENYQTSDKPDLEPINLSMQNITRWRKYVLLANMPPEDRQIFRVIPNALDRMNNLSVTLPGTTEPVEVIITFLYLSKKDSLYKEYMQYFYESEYPDIFTNPLYSNGETKLKNYEPVHPTDQSNEDFKFTEKRFHDTYFINTLGCSDIGIDHTVFGKHYVKLYTKDTATTFNLSELLSVNSNLDTGGLYSVINSPKYREENDKYFHPYFCKFSFVVSCNNNSIKTAVEDALPACLLYKNRNNQDLIDQLLPIDITDWETDYYTYVNDLIFADPLNMAIANDVLVCVDDPSNFQRLAIRTQPSLEEYYDPAIVGKTIRNPYKDDIFTEGIQWGHFTLESTETTYSFDRIEKAVGMAILPASPVAPILASTSIPTLSDGGPILDGLFEDKDPDDIFTMLFITGKLPNTLATLGDEYHHLIIWYANEPRISPDRTPVAGAPWWRYKYYGERGYSQSLNHPTGNQPVQIFVPLFLFRHKAREPGYTAAEEIELDEVNCFHPLFSIEAELGPILEDHHDVTSLGTEELPPPNNVAVGEPEAWSVILIDNQWVGMWFSYGSQVNQNGSTVTYYFWGTDATLIENWYVTRDLTVTLSLSDEVLVDKFQNVIDYLKNLLNFGNKREDYIEWYYSKVTRGIIDMGWELMIQEIHACLGASDFSFYGANPRAATKTSVAWGVDKIVRSFGINYASDGSVQNVVLNPPTPPVTPP